MGPQGVESIQLWCERRGSANLRDVASPCPHTFLSRAQDLSTSRFPDTRHSVVQALAGDDVDRRREAGELLARAYRAPVVALFRWRRGLEAPDAEDLAQGFFLAAFTKDWFTRYDPSRGRFRTFVRTCAERFAANAATSEGREKRGGGHPHVSLDTIAEAAGDDDAEARFRAEWVRSVLALALDALEEEAMQRDRGTHLALFREYDLVDGPRPGYAELGRRHGLGDSQVINHLAWARRRFRHHVLDVVRRLAGSEAEYREDVRDLLGSVAP